MTLFSTSLLDVPMSLRFGTILLSLVNVFVMAHGKLSNEDKNVCSNSSCART